MTEICVKTQAFFKKLFSLFSRSLIQSRHQNYNMSFVETFVQKKWDARSSHGLMMLFTATILLLAVAVCSCEH